MTFLRCLAFLIFSSLSASAGKGPGEVPGAGPIRISEKAGQGAFLLAAQGKPPVLVVDTADAEVVEIAAEALGKDIGLVTGIQPARNTWNRSVRGTDLTAAFPPGSPAVLIGTLGRSGFIDQLAKEGKIAVDSVKGKWETFCIARVQSPGKGTREALVIFGSDPRGTAFGVFELSRMMGVSPFVWWADVLPRPLPALYVMGDKSITGPPSVRYRGIFINDEDWGLHPWAAGKMDTTVRDIGPNTYQRVFELLLRLKANYIWPAMHPCTKAFWFYQGNPEMARRYDIVLGASHCEPMLRNNVFEWAENFKNEYGVEPGTWRYDSNRLQIRQYWMDRIRSSGHNDAVYTVGMRGIHDGSMPGPKSKKDKADLLSEVIRDQREMLAGGLGKPVSEIPQIFCPYKEVLDLYRMGLDLPEDITLTWADDNYGYMRQLSNPQEQKRAGGSGVYYHFSYWGKPEDYLWLSSISPMLTSYELTKAYQLGADKVWIFNVGDIKPAEAELQFAMDLAWDIHAWPPEKAYQYPEYWAGITFGKELAGPIGRIRSEYYRLAASGKPEQLDGVHFTGKEAAQRLRDYQAIAREADTLASHIPHRLKDAYFELVAYPVKAAWKMNEKIEYARESLQLAAEGKQEALTFSAAARSAYDEIQRLTQQYNTGIAHGKWNGIMSCAPRGLSVFQMPEVAAPEKIHTIIVADSVREPAVLPASGYSKAKGLEFIQGLGIGKGGLTVWPLPARSYDEEDVSQAPYAEYKVDVRAGNNMITVRCLPDFPLYDGLPLRYAISIGGSKPEWASIATTAESRQWADDVLRGYASGQTFYYSDSDKAATLRIYFPDPGLVVSSIVVGK
jgi:hypothetical protein